MDYDEVMYQYVILYVITGINNNYIKIALFSLMVLHRSSIIIRGKNCFINTQKFLVVTLSRRPRSFIETPFCPDVT